jgi:hypothetical protein
LSKKRFALLHYGLTFYQDAKNMTEMGFGTYHKVALPARNCKIYAMGLDNA